MVDTGFCDSLRGGPDYLGGLVCRVLLTRVGLDEFPRVVLAVARGFLCPVGFGHSFHVLGGLSQGACIRISTVHWMSRGFRAPGKGTIQHISIVWFLLLNAS